jgi:hypothetical protein
MTWQYLVTGMVIGLFGWLLYWAGLPVIGAMIGGSVGGSLGYVLSGLVTSGWGLPVMTGLGIVLGAAFGMFLVKTLQIYFFFVTGASLGGAFGYKLVAAGVFGLAASSAAAWGLVALCALAGGLILVWGRRFIVAFVTSIIGSVCVSLGFPPDWQNVAMVVALVMFLAVQIGLVRKFVDQEAFDRRTRRRLRAHDYPDVDTAD